MIVEAIVEIQAGSRFKYEINGDGWLSLDRVISIPYPANYGFIPETLELDGDPLDIFILSTEPIAQLARVNVMLIAGIICKDDGIQDNKLVGVIKDDFAIETFIINDICTFLTSYKKNFVLENIVTKEDALQLYIDAQLRLIK